MHTSYKVIKLDFEDVEMCPLSLTRHFKLWLNCVTFFLSKGDLVSKWVLSYYLNVLNFVNSAQNIRRSQMSSVGGSVCT